MKYQKLSFFSPKNAEEASFWISLAGPMILLVPVLKLWRVIISDFKLTLWEVLAVVRSDVLFVLGFSLAAFLALRISRTRKVSRVFVFALVYIFVLLWIPLEVAAHQYYLVTGSVFDLYLLFYVVENFREVVLVLTSVVSIKAVTVGSVLLLLGLIVPLAVWNWAAEKEFESRHQDGELLHWFVISAIALVLTGFSVVVPADMDHRAFGRSNAINAFLSVYDVYLTGEVESTLERESLLDITLASTEKTKQRNVALVILETTGADSVSIYESDPPTTPFLRELATRSLVAERAYSVVPHTSKAIVGMLCGFEPNLEMPITEASDVDGGIPGRCLADLLDDEGYATLFIQSVTEHFENRRELVSRMGYNDFIPLEDMNPEGYERASFLGYEDMLALPYSTRWIEENRGRPFFATYLTITPHYEYLAPRRFGFQRFSEDDVKNRYLNGVHYVDQFSRELMDSYKEIGEYEDTIFVFVGDHGEGFEPGRVFHNDNIWNTGIKIPWIIYDPQNPEGSSYDGTVAQIDLVPSILALMNYEVEGGEYPGMPFWEASKERAVFSHCWTTRTCMARIQGSWKYIDHFNKRLPEIYNLEDDPSERVNLYREMPEEGRQWRAELYGWRTAVLEMYLKYYNKDSR